MESKKSIEFYMVVTNRAVFLADYCIESYKNVYDYLSQNYDVCLVIYLNCLNKEKYQKYIDRWSQIKFVKIVYSKLNLEDFKFIPEEGEYFVEKTGKKYRYPMEYAEPFDWGYSNFQADYFINVDDDLEIVNSEFIEVMLNVLENDPNLGIISTNKTTTREYFDSYSNDDIILNERNDTWFCIYTKKSRVSGVSGHFFEKCLLPDGSVLNFDFENGNYQDYRNRCKAEGGKRLVMDGTGYLQSLIREKFKSKIISVVDIDPRFENQFIHYSSFTQNKSVNTPFKVSVYRILVLRKKIGFSKLPNSLNKYVKYLNKIVFNFLFKKSVLERKLDSAKSSLD